MTQPHGAHDLAAKACGDGTRIRLSPDGAVAEAAHTIETGGRGRWAAAMVACLAAFWPALATRAADGQFGLRHARPVGRSCRTSSKYVNTITTSQYCLTRRPLPASITIWYTLAWSSLSVPCLPSEGSRHA